MENVPSSIEISLWDSVINTGKGTVTKFVASSHEIEIYLRKHIKGTLSVPNLGATIALVQHDVDVGVPQSPLVHAEVAQRVHGRRALVQPLDAVGQPPGLGLVAPRVRLLLRVSVQYEASQMNLI